MNKDVLNLWQKVWIDFVEEEKLDQKILHPYICNSWQKCKTLRIDPYQEQMTLLDENTFQSIKEKNKQIISIVKPLMIDLFEAIRYLSFAVVLFDKNGYCLEMIGDEKVIKYSSAINFRPGVNMQEEYAGTNDVALSIIHNDIIGMKGYEYFCKIMHKYRNASCPIHNTKNEIVGVFSLVGIRDLSLPLNVKAMVKASAHMVENVLKAKEITESLIISNNLNESIIESSFAGIIVYNEEGKIIAINSSAQRILKYTKDELLNIKQIIDFMNEEFLSLNKQIKNLEIDLQTKYEKITCLANIMKIKDKEEKDIGIIIAFEPLSEVKKLVTTVMGNRASYTFDDIIGKSEAIEAVKKIAHIASATSANILIQGQSGTGKELIAQAIHNESSRKNNPFIAINCAAIPKELIESELFGYVEGAFTGARKGGQIGKFELASSGTIFLDEIGDMPIDLQSKLLRVLQNKEIYRIGGIKPIIVDIHVICATNKDLLEMMKKELFREELYYRINVITINVPPLKERKEDIEILTNYFIKKLNKHLNKNIIGITPEVKNFFYNYSWPGNIRELENTIEYAMILCNSIYISLSNLPDRIKETNFSPIEEKFLLDEEFKEQEESNRKLYLQALKLSNGRVEKAAEILKISRSTLYRKLKKYGIK